MDVSAVVAKARSGGLAQTFAKFTFEKDRGKPMQSGSESTARRFLPSSIHLSYLHVYLPSISEWKKSFASTRRNSSSDTGAPPFIFSLRL